jgi:hypothetical protein
MVKDDGKQHQTQLEEPYEIVQFAHYCPWPKEYAALPSNA